MIGERAKKSKPNTRKVTARAGNREIYSNCGKERAKARERECASSGLARAGTRLSLHSNPARPKLVHLPRSRLVKALLPLRQSRRSPPQAPAQGSDQCSPYLRIRMAVVPLREESSHHNDVKQKTFARWQSTQ
jgi:hypothetical protein